MSASTYTAKAELLFTDGTRKTVEVDVPSTLDATAFGTDEPGKLTKYDIVSYTVDSDDVYSLNLVADAADGKAGANVELVTNGRNTINAAVDNKANLGSSPKYTTVAGDPFPVLSMKTATLPGVPPLCLMVGTLAKPS